MYLLVSFLDEIERVKSFDILVNTGSKKIKMEMYHLDTVVLTLMTTFLLYKYFTRSFNYWKMKNVPFIKPTFFIGNFSEAATFKRTLGHMLADMYNKMSGPFFGIWVFNTPHLIIRSPELIKHILVKDFKHFEDRAATADENVDSMSSKVLFFMKNPEWKIVRNKMTPAFTSGKIKGMIPIMNEAGEDLKTYLTKISVTNSSIEAKELCAKYSTDLITSCAFGIQAHCFDNEDAPFRKVGKQIFDFNLINGIRAISYFFLPAMVRLFRIQFIPDNVSKFLRGAFWHTIDQRKETGTKRNDVVDLIIKIKKENDENGVNFEGDDVVAQAVQFFLAGFETTSSTIAFALYELCLNKNIQQSLRAEIRSVLKEHNGNITYEGIQSMKYLQQVVAETLRKYPVLPFLDRRCTSDYKIPDTDVVLEKGTPVCIPMFGLHYDPKYFPDPERFDPERFSEQNINSIPNYTYIPFGTGPHNCIGERFGMIATKLGLVHILSQFEVERSHDTPVPLRFATKSLVLLSEDGLPMKFVNVKRRMSVAA